MGIVVVGGMLTSTFLTLYVVPVVYTMFSDLSKRKATKPTKASKERRLESKGRRSGVKAARAKPRFD